MHAISRTAFLTFGTSFLVLMVFLGAALHFDIFPLQQISELIAHFSFLGYSIPELLGVGKVGSYRELTEALKMIFVVTGLFVSISTIGISFLPSFHLQLKALSFGLSIPPFVILFNFWIYFISDDRDILREDKILLYLFTIIVYSFSVILMWYGLHVRRKSPSLGSANDINPMRSHLIQKSIPTAEELSREMVTKTQSAKDTEKEALDPGTKSNDPEEVLGAEPREEETQEQHTVSDSVSAEPNQAEEATERTAVEKEAIVTQEDLQKETVNNQKADHSVQDPGEEKMEDEAP